MTKSELETTHAGAVVWRRGVQEPQFLLITPRRRYDEWLLPKGRIERGEQPHHAARREIGEETGLDVEVGEQLGRNRFQYRRQGKLYAAVCVYYLAESLGAVASGCGLDPAEIKLAAQLAQTKDGRVMSAPEARQALWVPIARALRMASYAGIRQMLEKASEVETLATSGLGARNEMGGR